ncbi:hypothetical protein EV356DRAFT_444753 [Viridothelium virens]|uniref:Glycosyl transferase CAP10 domain-containing protein n=1 Tax=Viridothelium virens TaxID=1048519 RepID=A0A6A6HC60_VIRVR|nr:hypothetical protein EV356DRAFT_444753 [Viridothelium virens]
MFSQRWPVFVGVTVVILIFLFSFSEHTDIRSSWRPKPSPPVQPIVVPATESSDWTFQAARDGLNLGLSDQRCNEAFPKLYAEIDRAVDFHRKRGGIQRSQIKLSDDPIHAQAHCLIYDGELYIVEERLRAYHVGPKRDPRISASVGAVYRSLVALPNPRVVPNVEFIIDVEDWPGDGNPERTIWGFSRDREDNNTWIMPDHGGWSPFDVSGVGSYRVFRDNVRINEQPFKDKIPKAVYRGTKSLNQMREHLVEVTKNKPWADAAHTNKDNHILAHKFCDYQYLFHVEGKSWSGRLRYLANCESVMLIPSLNYIAHFYPLLESEGPSQNYVHVEHDFSDLESKMEHYISHPEEAARIAEEARSSLRDRYLTPAAEACYHRRMYKSWSELQQWEPELWKEVKDEASGKTHLERRGVGYEAWELPNPFPK